LTAINLTRIYRYFLPGRIIKQPGESYLQATGKLLPTRGNRHDLSGAITHKRQIITLYLEGYLAPDIAMKTNHSIGRLLKKQPPNNLCYPVVI